MSTILVLSGGISAEREVSLRSGASVTKALEAKGFTVVNRDPKDGLDNLGQIDAAFPALHGLGGEDGAIQAELQKLHIPYVGSDAAASALCFDKWAYKQMLRKAGLPVAEDALVTKETIWQSPLTHRPFVLKPIEGGSTIDTFIVRDPAHCDRAAIEAALGRYPDMLLEELVEGIEITVGVLGQQPLPCIESVPPTGGEFDYENKYNGKTQELCPPEHISGGAQVTAQELALQAHHLTDCRDLSRTDIIIRPDGRQVILETNTLPGMTDQSLFPKAAAAASIPMEDLVERLVLMALTRA